jgi:hypothetical protein
VITLNITNSWEVVDTDNIKGRLNVMWLSPEGLGVSTRKFSHMTILNMICEKSNVNDFWDVQEIKSHNIHDAVQLELPNFEGNNLELAELMKSFMKATKFVRISGPYREYEMSEGYGHASRLLEKRKFVVESYHPLTDEQTKFVQKVIDTYNLDRREEVLIRDFTDDNVLEEQIYPMKKVDLYFDREVEGVFIPNGIPEEYTKFYVPIFDAYWFRKETGVEPAVYPTDMRQSHFSNMYNVENLSIDEKQFKGYYLIEGFGSALNAMGLNNECRGIYESVFKYIGDKSLKLLQDGVLKLCVCYLQESFITDNIIHAIHYNSKRLNINNFYVIVNDFLVQRRYLGWCRKHNEEPRFKAIVFCHSLVEKSHEISKLLEGEEIYHLADDYEDHQGSALSLDEFYKSKDKLRDNTILSMNRRLREHRIATLCVLSKNNLVKDNGVSFQFTIDKNYPYNVNGFFRDMERYNDYKIEFEKLREMEYQYVDYPLALEAKDGMNHGYGWENKLPYINSYINITTETDFVNPTGYASEKVWKPIAYLQPFVLVGSPHTLKFIKSFGFKTFEGFIDESYDSVEEIDKRFALIEKEIEKISKMSKQEIHDWYWSMEDILVHNHKLFLEIGKHKADQYKNMFKELGEIK